MHAQSGILRQQLACLLTRPSNSKRADKEQLQKAVVSQLELACKAADPSPSPEGNGPTSKPRGFRGRVEGAFLHLHAAELMLVELFSVQEMEARIPYVVTRLRTCMGPRSHLPPAIEQQFLGLRRHRDERCLRAVFANAMRAAYAASDEQHMLLKQLRTIVYTGL